MKVCASCNVPKDLSQFGRNQKNFKHGAQDGKSIYCRPCNVGFSTACKARKKAKRRASKAPTQYQLDFEAHIRLMLKTGASRNELKRATKAPMDLIVDTLAEWWDRGEIFSRRYGEDRLFYTKAA